MKRLDSQSWSRTPWKSSTRTPKDTLSRAVPDDADLQLQGAVGGPVVGEAAHVGAGPPRRRPAGDAQAALAVVGGVARHVQFGVVVGAPQGPVVARSRSRRCSGKRSRASAAAIILPGRLRSCTSDDGQQHDQQGQAQPADRSPRQVTQPTDHARCPSGPAASREAAACAPRTCWMNSMSAPITAVAMPAASRCPRSGPLPVEHQGDGRRQHQVHAVAHGGDQHVAAQLHRDGHEEGHQQGHHQHGPGLPAGEQAGAAARRDRGGRGTSQVLGFQVTCFLPCRNCQNATALAKFTTHR